MHSVAGTDYVLRTEHDGQLIPKGRSTNSCLDYTAAGLFGEDGKISVIVNTPANADEGGETMPEFIHENNLLAHLIAEQAFWRGFLEMNPKDLAKYANECCLCIKRTAESLIKVLR